MSRVTCTVSPLTWMDTVCAGEHVLAADQRAPAHELHSAAPERAHGRHPGLAAAHARLPRHDQARGVTAPGQPCISQLFRSSVKWSLILSGGQNGCKN